jgi:hypothetical protein
MRKKHTFLKLLVFVIVGISVAANIVVLAALFSNADLCSQLRNVRDKWLPRANNDLPGGWNRVDTNGPSENKELAKQMKELESLAYLSGSRAAPGGESVVHYDEGYAYDGYNLYNSAHAPEAMLLDMTGGVVHQWSISVEDVWPDFDPEEDAWGHTCWRRVHLYPNGDLLGIFVGVGLVKLDKDSNLLWAYRSVAHHDVDVAPDGTIYLLTRKAGVDPRFHAKKPMLIDYVTVLDPDGNLIRNISLLDAFENSAYVSVIGRIKKLVRLMNGYGDIFHTNAITVLDGTLSDKIPAFRRGNLLLSPLFPEMICVLDVETETIVWGYAAGGTWFLQHEPTVMDSGNILLFDNRGDRGNSRVVEFNPMTGESEWVFTGSEERRFYSETCGTCQRLPNGNTLITESEAGRVFEVTPDKLIVWEFVSPHRTGEKSELVATLFDMHRVETETVAGWLQPE